MTSSTLLISLFQYKAWANAELFNALLELDKDTYCDELHASIRILNHTYVVDQIFKAQLLGLTHSYQGTNTEQTPPLDTLFTHATATDLWYLDYVTNLDHKLYHQEIQFNFTDGGRGSMSREEILAHIITHGGYHRGAVGRILSQLSIAPPRDIFTRFLHDTQPSRA